MPTIHGNTEHTTSVDRMQPRTEPKPRATAHPDPDQPGLWYYDIDGQRSDVSYPSRAEALLFGLEAEGADDASEPHAGDTITGRTV